MKGYSPTPSYTPSAGDFVWLQFDPQAGHEQAGHRPALVISPGEYNSKTSLMLCCPITKQIKGYPFEVHVDELTGVVLADQVKSLDWSERRAVFKGRISDEKLADVKKKIISLIDEI